MDHSTVDIAASSEEGERIGGWLILVAIGLVFSLLSRTVQLFGTFVPLFSNGSWKVLTTPGSEAYHPLWKPLLTFEIIANLIVLGLVVYVMVLFFQRKRQLPKWIIGLYLLNLAVVAVDQYAASFLPLTPGEASDSRELFRSIVACVIWVPYFLISERVKKTFVK